MQGITAGVVWQPAGTPGSPGSKPCQLTSVWEVVIGVAQGLGVAVEGHGEEQEVAGLQAGEHHADAHAQQVAGPALGADRYMLGVCENWYIQWHELKPLATHHCQRNFCLVLRAKWSQSTMARSSSTSAVPPNSTP